MTEFATRFQSALEFSGLNLSELSRKTGIDQGSLSHYKKGDYEPTRSKIELISRALNVDPAYLCGFGELRHPDVSIADLTPTEKKIINFYRSASNNEKEMLERMCKVT